MAQDEPAAGPALFPIQDAVPRYQAWLNRLKQQNLFPTEHLLPQFPMPCPRELPALMRLGDGLAGADPAALRKRIDALRPGATASS